MAGLSPEERERRLDLALSDPRPVTVGGLNKVYRYIMSRISGSSSSGSSYYKIQGDIQSFTELLALGNTTDINNSGVTEGIIYNVVGADPTGALGVNYVCVRQHRVYNGRYQAKVYKTARMAGITEYDSSYVYYKKVSTDTNDYQIISNPGPELFKPDTWYVLVFEDFKIGETFVDSTNILEYSNNYYTYFWDSFGGSQPIASDAQLGVIKIGNNVNIEDDGKISINTADGTGTLGLVKQGDNVSISNGVISVAAANGTGTLGLVKQGDNVSISNGVISVAAANSSGALGLVKQGNNTEINNSGVIRVPLANEAIDSSDPTQGVKPGVLKVGDKIGYSDNTINLSEGNAISIGTGDNAGQISVLYDGATIQKTTDSTNKLYARTASAGSLGVVTVESGNTGTIQLKMTEGESPESTGILVVRTASNGNTGIVRDGTGTNIGASNGAVNITYDTDTLDIGDGTGEGHNGKNVNALFVKKATSSTAGIVSQGNYIEINSNGEISASKATTSSYGVVKPLGTTKIINDDGEVYGVDNSTIEVDDTNNCIKVKKSAIAQSGTNVNVANDGKISVTSLDVTNDSGNAVKITGTKSTSTSEPSSSTSPLYVNGDIYAEGYIRGSKVFHAVWNDISDAIEVQDDLDVEPGFCYMFDGKTYKKTEEYCQKGVLGIHSDTAGDILGRKGRHKELDIAIGGFVLAHVDDIYESGTPLTCGPDGCLTEMKREDVREYPERLIATYWKPESEEFWGPEDSKITVNGRDWVKVK